MNETQEIGTRLRELREGRGKTQDELAEILELTKSSVSRIESGDRGLAAAELAVLARYLNVPTDVILFGAMEDEVLLRAEGDATEAAEYASGVIDDFEYLLALGT